MSINDMAGEKLLIVAPGLRSLIGALELANGAHWSNTIAKPAVRELPLRTVPTTFGLIRTIEIWTVSLKSGLTGGLTQSNVCRSRLID
jgi:hypothetical protein